jgi:MATE family multidrug resistance protein
MNKEILRLAVPNILSNISIPLLSTVDTALMGRLSEAHIGAVGVGAMIFNFVYWNFGFLRMGTTGMTAQTFGRNDNLGIANNLGRAVLVALILAGLILVLQVPFGEASFHLMNASGEQKILLEEYFFIRIYAAPATLALFAFFGWFFGMQNAIYPLILTIIINVVNIALSYIFVWEMEMGVAGVAWGTVIAQYVGLVGAVVLFLSKYSSFLQYLKRETILKVNELKRFLIINRDIFIRTVCLTFAFGFFYSQSSAEGEMLLAVNVILMQFVNWMSYAVDGFAFASESLVGKYVGANDETQTHRAIKLSFSWGMFFAFLFSLVYLFYGTNLLYVFTDKMDVIEASLPYLSWLVVFPIISTPCYIWDGVFIGMTASVAMRNCMVLALVVFLLVYYSTISYGNHGLWLTLSLFMLSRAVFQWIAFKKFGLALK